jgi:hypothetical protein
MEGRLNLLDSTKSIHQLALELAITLINGEVKQNC